MKAGEDENMSVVNNISVPNNEKIRDAQNFLTRKHNQLIAYDSIEHLVLEGEAALGASDYSGVMYHLLAVRAELAKVLWEAEVYIGVSIIDEFVFQSAKKASKKIVKDVLSDFSLTHVGKTGFVLYPIHGFGIERPPLLRNDPTLKSFYHFKRMGICLSPQSNSFEGALKQVSKMAASLDVCGQIDPSDLAHHTRAGTMDWFTRNPLMMVKIASHTGNYYENQFIYTLKIRIAAALISMLYALGTDKGYQVDKLTSTANINNWETLDIRHYLIGESQDQKTRPVDLRRVPMNVAALGLARLSDMTLSLNSKSLGLSFLKSADQRLSIALKIVESGYLTNVNIASSDKVRSRVFARIVTALDWYSQSFNARVTGDEAVVALAVAFETLLTDAYGKGVGARIKRRASICLKGKHGVRDYIASIVSVMNARGEIVHNGSTVQEADIVKSQAAFALCFEAIVNRLDSLPNTLDQPIGKILVDA